MPNPTPSKKKKKKQITNSNNTASPPPFEFCEVCNLNHNAGRKHKYFPNHAKSLSSLLSRFLHKLSHLRLSLSNPSLHSSPHRLWCIFCRCDVPDPDGSVTCSGAIYHLASEEHFGNLKEFLFKHGGGIDRVDYFRVSAEELVKWKKKCEALKSAAQSSSGGGLNGSLQASSKDIHYQLGSNNINSLENASIHYFSPSVSHDVMPLQSFTDEGHLQSCHDVARISNGASVPSVEPGPQNACASGSRTEYLTANSGSQPLLAGSGQMVAYYSNSEMVKRADPGKEWINGGSHASQYSCRANTHLECQSPWLEADAEATSPAAKKRCLNGEPPTVQTEKSQKLNPKRVGAVWAEKRRIELEMEKRGEIVLPYDPNWLPNFGGVWQAGTRKDSRKEFDMVKRKVFKQDMQPDTSVQIQPYVSKRMRLGQNRGGSSSIDGGAG